MEMDFLVINVGNGFSSRPYVCPPCVCVTGLTGTPTYGQGVPESQIPKK
jgi:hypothetical protein